MVRSTLNVDAIIVEALMSSDDVESGGLRNDHHVGARPPLDDVKRAETSRILLGDDAGENEVAFEPHAGTLQRDHGAELTGDATLHVDRAAAKQLAVDDARREWVRHRTGRHRID